MPSLEQLTEKPKQPGEKPPPESRRLRRSHTDPTDLLEVFRRRANLLEQQNNRNRVLPKRKYGCAQPYRVEDGGGHSFDQRRESNGAFIDKVGLNTILE